LFRLLFLPVQNYATAVASVEARVVQRIAAERMRKEDWAM
jgi:hypothetical protein